MDSDWIWVWIVLAACVLVVSIVRGRKRASELEQAAARVGLSFRKKGGSVDHLRNLPLFQIGQRGPPRSIVEGEVGGHRVVMFEFTCGRGQTFYDQTVATFRVSGPDKDIRVAHFDPNWSVECNGEWVMIYTPKGLVHPSNLELFLKDATRILDLFLDG